MFTFVSVVLAAIIFEYSNGFHDAANAIATVVSTKVLTPRQAIAMAACFNLTGALLGGAVASTIGKGLVEANAVTMATVILRVDCGLCLEHYDLVVRFAVKLKSRARRRTLRRGSGHGEWQLVCHKMECRFVAKSCCSHDHFAGRRIYIRRAPDVFTFFRAAPFHALFRARAFWPAANLECSLDGT